MNDDCDDENRIFAARQHLKRARVKNVFHDIINTEPCLPHSTYTPWGEIFFD